MFAAATAEKNLVLITTKRDRSERSQSAQNTANVSKLSIEKLLIKVLTLRTAESQTFDLRPRKMPEKKTTSPG